MKFARTLRSSLRLSFGGQAGDVDLRSFTRSMVRPLMVSSSNHMSGFRRSLLLGLCFFNLAINSITPNQVRLLTVAAMFGVSQLSDIIISNYNLADIKPVSAEVQEFFYKESEGKARKSYRLFISNYSGHYNCAVVAGNFIIIGDGYHMLLSHALRNSDNFEFKEIIDDFKGLHDHEVLGHFNSYHHNLRAPFLAGTFLVFDISWDCIRPKLESIFLKSGEVGNAMWLRRGTIKLFMPLYIYLLMYSAFKSEFKLFEKHADSCVRDELDVLIAQEKHFRARAAIKESLISRLKDLFFDPHPSDKSRADYFKRRIEKLQKETYNSAN